MKMAQCRGCGAAIIWIITVNGKRAPVDAKPIQGYSLEEWNVGGKVELHGVMKKIYQSHHATCPKAAQFRKGKKVG